MKRLSAVAVVLAWAVAGCDSAQPCPTGSCPVVNGAWSMSWTDGFRPAGCMEQGPRPMMLNFVQSNSDLKTTVGGQDLSGTILDTWTFTLNGGQTPGYSLHGTALSDGADAGIHLEGSLTVVGSECTIDDGFVGQKL